MAWNVEHLESVESTNTWLVERAMAGADEGLVLYCDYQSAGRGRLGREWRAAPGSALLCSALVSLPGSLSSAQWMVGAAALALRDALELLTAVRPVLKWPNDVLFGDAKVAGLLAEVVGAPGVTKVVIGLGVNLTEVDPTFNSATTVRLATGCSVSPSDLLSAYLDALAARRVALATPDGFATLRHDYRDALSTLGRRVRVELMEGSVRGLAVDVDESGALLVDSGSGIRSMSAGDVVHLRREDNQ